MNRFRKGRMSPGGGNGVAHGSSCILVDLGHATALSLAILSAALHVALRMQCFAPIGPISSMHMKMLHVEQPYSCSPAIPLHIEAYGDGGEDLDSCGLILGNAGGGPGAGDTDAVESAEGEEMLACTT